jgi:hypothetical protein
VQERRINSNLLASSRSLPHCCHATAAVRALLGCQQRINLPYSLLEARFCINDEWTLTIR